MCISSALLIPRLSMPATGCCACPKNLEQESLRCFGMDGAPKPEQQESVMETRSETHIVESSDNVELYFVWPIPLVFDEFTVD